MPEYSLEEDCPLFRLPFELREYTYELAFTPGDPERLPNEQEDSLSDLRRLNPIKIVPAQDESTNKTIPSALLRTCQALYHEAFPAVFRVATFRWRCRPHVPRKEAIHLVIKPHHYLLLRNIALDMPMHCNVLDYPPATKHLKSFQDFRDGQVFHVRFCCMGCRQGSRRCQMRMPPLPTHLLELFGVSLRGFRQVVFSTNLEREDMTRDRAIHCDRSMGHEIWKAHDDLMADLTARLGSYLGDCEVTEDPEGVDELDQLIYRPRRSR